MGNMSDCKSINKSSRYIRTWLQKQPEVKEESLTDWLLYDISQNIPRIKYKSFSRHVEARQAGADWEWWIIFSKFSFKMRVQAKKIDVSGDNYPAIAYTNRFGLQIEKLLKDANKTGSIPLYALYSPVTASVKCIRHRAQEGVFIAGGKEIYDSIISIPRAFVSCSDLLSRSVALSCFFCCPLLKNAGNGGAPGPGSDTTGEGFLAFLDEYYSEEFAKKPAEQLGAEEEHVSKGKFPGVYSNPPSYVESFIRNGQGETPEWWEKEFKHNIEDLNALVVYDMRPD